MQDRKVMQDSYNSMC